MKHQTIYKKLGISYKNYTKLRCKYRFFAYFTDILTLDYVLNLSEEVINQILLDLQEILTRRTVLRGLDLALFGELNCFKAENLENMRNFANTITHYQSHKWNYDDINNPGTDTSGADKSGVDYVNL
ncbi:MAG: hypothetical protein ACK5WP_08535 [Neisseriaceae bacterium]